MAANEDDFHTLDSGTGFDQTGLRIIHLSQTSLQFQNGFEHLVSEFFESCRDKNAKETFWIIRVTKNGEINEGVHFFAAAKDDSRRHVEQVFTDWWDLYIKHRQKDKDHQYQFEIYSNYAPRPERENLLNNWLEEKDLVNLSIHYVFNNNDVARDKTETKQTSDGTSFPNNRVEIKPINNPTSELEKLEKEIRLKMDWQIVKLNGYDDPKLVPAKLLKTENQKCWLKPCEGLTINDFEAAVADLDKRKEDSNYNATSPEDWWPVERILRGAADYQSGITILKSISGANGSDAAVVSAPKVDSNLVQTSLQFQNGFNYFVPEFLKSCRDENRGPTFWIIKLTKICDKESKYTFAAATNDWESRYVEEVFTDWWESGQKHDYKNPLEVYTTYAPSSDCAELLNEWLKKSKVKLSINYKFPDPSYPISQIEEKFKPSIKAGKFAIKEIPVGSLEQLADDIRGRM